jgi:hypothetical protein
LLFLKFSLLKYFLSNRPISVSDLIFADFDLLM